MFNVDTALIPSVKRLVKALDAKVLSYTDLKNDEELCRGMTREGFNEESGGFYNSTFDVIILNDEDNVNLTTVVLHELIHWSGAKGRLKREAVLYGEQLQSKYMSGEEISYEENFKYDKYVDTEEATAEIGKLKLMLLLGFIPAQYAEETLVFLKKLRRFDLEKADRDSDEAVEYLVKFIGMEKVA